jgi:hypothetical protein
MGNGALVRRQLRWRMNDALVQRHDHKCTVSSGRGNITRHCIQRLGVGGLQRRGRSGRAAVGGMNLYVGAASPTGCGPAGLRSDAVVAQQRDRSRFHREPGRCACLLEIRARATMTNSQAIQFRAGIGDTLGTAVGHVIPGERHNIDTRPPQRCQVRRQCTGRRHIATELNAAKRVRYLQVTDYAGGRARAGGNPAQPMVRVGRIQYQIAREEQLQSRPPDVLDWLIVSSKS